MEINASTLRSNRNKDFSKISQEFDNIKNPKTYVDERFWKLEKDKAGNGTAVIRFLPRVEGDDLPWAKVFNHGFKTASGRWFIEDCLTSIGDPCPVCEFNSKLYNSTTDDKSPERKQVSAQKRKLNYISNILVINDPKHPENNGKVFLFKYGKKIFDKIMDKARPTFEDEEPINVFDYWEGANFKLRMKTVDGFANYDSSEFESISEIAPNDERILEIAKAQYKLSEFLDKAKFKSYDTLKTKLNEVLGSAPAERTQRAESMELKETRRPVQTSAPEPAPTYSDDEDAMKYFQSIADDDAPF